MHSDPKCLLHGPETSNCPKWLVEGARGVLTNCTKDLPRVSCTAATRFSPVQPSFAPVQQAFGSHTLTTLSNFRVSHPCSKHSGLQSLAWWTFRPRKKIFSPPPKKIPNSPPTPSRPLVPSPSWRTPPSGIFNKNRPPLPSWQPQTPPSPSPSRTKKIRNIRNVRQSLGLLGGAACKSQRFAGGPCRQHMRGGVHMAFTKARARQEGGLWSLSAGGGGCCGCQAGRLSTRYLPLATKSLANYR